MIPQEDMDFLLRIINTCPRAPVVYLEPKSFEFVLKSTPSYNLEAFSRYFDIQIEMNDQITDREREDAITKLRYVRNEIELRQKMASRKNPTQLFPDGSVINNN